MDKLIILRLLFAGAVGLMLFPFARVETSMAQGNAGNATRTAIAGTIGVVTLDSSGYKKNHELRFFNTDGSLWYRYSYETNEGVPQSARNSFGPLAFHPDYYLLALRCVRRDAAHFEVIVNEATGLTKLVKVSDGNMRLQTWRDHVLALFAVGFDQSTNPVRYQPAGRKYKPQPNGLTFFPIQIKGNWLKIRWRTSNQTRTHVGWIQWRDSRNLLIEPSYIS